MTNPSTENLKIGAMVLAAGFGSRLRPLTEERPKPLVEVFGRSLIEHNLDHLAKVGVSQVVINTHHLPDALPAALGADHAGMELRFLQETEILGTGGGLKNAKHLLQAFDLVFLLNADAFVDVSLEAMLQKRAVTQAMGALLLKQVPNVADFGGIGTDENDRVVSFVNRIPVKRPPVQERMFCGVHLFEPRFLDYLDETANFFCVNQQTYPAALLAGETVVGVDQPGCFQDVGTPERLLDLHWEVFSGANRLAHLSPFSRFEEVAPKRWVHPAARIEAETTVGSHVLIDANTRVEAGAHLVKNVVLGPRVAVGQGTVLERVVVQSGTEIPSGKTFRDCILYPGGAIAVKKGP